MDSNAKNISEPKKEGWSAEAVAALARQLGALDVQVTERGTVLLHNSSMASVVAYVAGPEGGALVECDDVTSESARTIQFQERVERTHDEALAYRRAGRVREALKMWAAILTEFDAQPNLARVLQKHHCVVLKASGNCHLTLLEQLDDKGIQLSIEERTVVVDAGINQLERSLVVFRDDPLQFSTTRINQALLLLRLPADDADAAARAASLLKEDAVATGIKGTPHEATYNAVLEMCRKRGADTK